MCVYYISCVRSHMNAKAKTANVLFLLGSYFVTL